MHILRDPRVLLLAGLGVLAGSVHAQQPVVIYRCTGPDGAVTVQNDRPCAKGDAQERRVMQGPGTPPAPAAPVPAARAGRAATAVVPAPPPVPLVPVPPAATGPYGAPAGTSAAPTATGPAATAAPPVSTADRPPPPALFACTAGDTRYFSIVANPPPRCAPLQTTGVGTAPPAGAACEMVSDTCTPVPAESLCASWRQHLNELETALTFGRLDERETARVELDRANGAVNDSLCGG